MSLSSSLIEPVDTEEGLLTLLGVNASPMLLGVANPSLTLEGDKDVWLSANFIVSIEKIGKESKLSFEIISSNGGAISGGDPLPR